MKRCLKILQDFCQYYLASVDREGTASRSDPTSEPRQTILEDLALYTGIVSTFKAEERRAKYGDIEQILGVLDSGTKPTKEQLEEHVSLLDRFYEIAEQRTNARERIAERIILGRNGNV